MADLGTCVSSFEFETATALLSTLIVLSDKAGTFLNATTTNKLVETLHSYHDKATPGQRVYGTYS